MDQESTFARVERTLWTVWCYFTEAVNRFIRTQEAGPSSSDPADGEPPDSEHTQDNTEDSHGGGISEVQLLPSISLLSSSASVVAWTVGTSDSKSEEGDTQKRRGHESKGSDGGKATRQEHVDQTGNDRAQLLVIEKETTNQLKREETENEESYTSERVKVTSEDNQVTGDNGDVLDEEKSEGVCTRTAEEVRVITGEEGEEENSAEELNTCMFQVSSEAGFQPSICDGDDVIVIRQEVGGEDDQTEDETAQMEEEDINEVANNQTKGEEEKQENSSRMTTDGYDEATLSTHCSEDAVQTTQENAEKFVDKGEKVVVTVTRSTSLSDVSAAGTNLDQIIVDEGEMDVERLSGKVHNKESRWENDCATSLVTVKPEGLKTEQEASRESKNIPQVAIEGQDPALNETIPKACEETQEGVPEHNNELGSDENKTQSFLERGNYGEIRNSQLPEEVEKEEQASLKNSGMGADYLLEEEQDLAVEELTGNLHFAQETEEPPVGVGNLECKEEEVECLDTSMKTEIKPSDKDETCSNSVDETNKDLQEAAELGNNQDETSNSLEVNVEMTETHFCQESMKSIEPSGDESFSLAKEIPDSGVLQLIESKLSDDSAVETQSVGADTEERDYTDEAEEEICVTGEELIISQEDKETPLTEQSESSPNPEAQATITQPSVETDQEDKIETITDTDAVESGATESKDLPAMPVEDTEHPSQPEEQHDQDTSSSIRGQEDVIDEEILDLWIEAAMSNDSSQEEEPQTDTMKDQMEEELCEMLPEESEQMPSSVSSTEKSLSNLDSGFLDQSSVDVQTPKPEDTGSLEDVRDTLATVSESASSSELSEDNSESRAVMKEETGESVESFLRGKESARGTEQMDSQEENQLTEKPETAGEENSSGTEAETKARGRDTEEGDEMSLVEGIDQNEEKMFGIAVELRVTEPRLTLLEETAFWTELCSGSEDKQRSEDAPDHRWSLPALSRGHVAARQTASEDQSQLDAPVLDITVQKSRIAVKNPKARPPKNPRSLIHKPSAEPAPSTHVLVKDPPSVPLGGLGIGIKLPGFGAGLPVLKKTQTSVEVENSQDTQIQEPETQTEEKSEGVKPKWKPPGHPGFGIPLMSELKTKLKKTPKE
nr:uncharacterized protein si:ch211-136m16.8 [Nothobranchius furzeri]XP_054605679.1 uncharacterized protein si:ch211-136m16.8 [Nothobranchius furzeri]